MQQFKLIKVSIQGVSDFPYDKLWKKRRIVMKSTGTWSFPTTSGHSVLVVYLVVCHQIS